MEVTRTSSTGNSKAFTIHPLRIISAVLGGTLTYIYAKQKGATGIKLLGATAIGAATGYAAMWAGEAVYGVVSNVGGKVLDKVVKP